jgi:pimeloyl-ACP methyl ester carboxylesterase
LKAVAQLRADSRFSSVMIAGHSEGSFIGTLAARRGAVDGLISLAGAGRRIGDVLRDQLSRAVSAELQVVAAGILTELEAGRNVEEVPLDLMMVFRPSIQPYMISWLAHDPAEELGRLTIPLMIVQGSTDLHTNASDAHRLHEANPRATLMLIEGMNHILKAADEPGGAMPPSYTNPTLPLHPELAAGVVAFVRSNCCAAGRK